MILLNNLYKLQDVTRDDKCTTYNIILDPDCIIYKAHFPEMPITPGVCIIQMVKELLEICTERKLNISGVKNAKFLSVLQPGGGLISVALSNIKSENEKVSAQALVFGADGVNYAKISLQTIDA